MNIILKSILILVSGLMDEIFVDNIFVAMSVFEVIEVGEWING